MLITGEPPKRAEDRKKPNPSACTGLAEHLLPRRHELIQSFPSREMDSDKLLSLVIELNRVLGEREESIEWQQRQWNKP